MSTTTQILFNSPALHSLRREQLVKLCKIHSIKANGKNVELIQRLRQHAQKMPKDSPLSIAARSEPSGPISIQPMEVAEKDQREEIEEAKEDVSYRSAMPRPSEQWEMIMDSIQEVEETSSQGSLSSQRTLSNAGTGEFGTGSSRSTTVSSSIKALASSLGLKRAMAKSTPASTVSSKSSATSRFPEAEAQIYQPNDDLAQNSTPYSSLPIATSLPQTDHFTLDPSARISLGGTPEPDESPLPGHALRPGVPAPPNARLSLGLGLGVPATPTRQAQPTTTIRLISNPLSEPRHSVDSSYGAGENGTPQLKPYKTTFNITFGSPAPGTAYGSGFGNLSSWPPNNEGEDVEMGGIYPKLTIDDMRPYIVCPPSKEATDEATNEDVDMPGSLSPIRNTASTTAGAASTNIAASNPPSPFIFGSPLPQHNVSNTQFRAAAASVLEEMNARLRAEGVDEIGTDIVAKLHPDRKVPNYDGREIKPIPASRCGEISRKFEQAHKEVFEKMEGIDGVLRKRMERERASPPKKVQDEKVVLGKKRKSSAIERDSFDAGPRRPTGRPNVSATRVISAGRRANVLPGAFDVDDEDDEDEDDQQDNNDNNDHDRAGKRVRMDPDTAVPPLTPDEQRKKDADDEERRIELEKEKEAIRKKLEANRARRRSSAVHQVAGGRKSIGGAGGRKSIGRTGPRPSLVKPKPKPSRFGFLSSAKSLVQSVWNKGKAPAAPSGIPKPTSTTNANTTTNTKQLSAAKGKEKMGPPAFVPEKKSAIAPAKSTMASAGGSGGKVPSIRVNNIRRGASPTTTQAHAQGSIASFSSRSRSPLPSFGTMSSLASSTGTDRSSLQSNAGRGVGSLAGTGKSRTSNASSAAGVSSVGTRLSATRVPGSSAGIVGSMGLKKAPGGTSRTSSMGTATSSSSRLSTASSRLLAPTASSLAKTARPSAGLKTVSEDSDKRNEKDKHALGMITNSATVNPPLPSNLSTPASTDAAPFSPRSGKIFSKPLLLPVQSGIPTPVKKRSGETSPEDGSFTNTNMTTTTTTITRIKSLNGRKPRISRSKVIARLASQRAASGSGSGSSATGSRTSTSGVLAPRLSGAASGGRTRSSLGAKVSRGSYGAGGGLKARASGGGGMAMNAKRRARQSEYARRKSRVGAGSAMEVDSNE